MYHALHPDRIIAGGAFALLCCLGLTCQPLRADDARAALVLDDPAWSKRQVAAGVQLLQRRFEDLFGAEQFVSILAVDLDEPSVRLRITAIEVGSRRQTVDRMAEQAGAAAAINGGFGHGGMVNSGIIKIDDRILPFLTQDQEPLSFVGSAAVGIDAQGQMHFRLRPEDDWPDAWPEVEHALAGGHMLLIDGEVHSMLKEQPAPGREARHVRNRHPRTAIGRTAGNVALLVAVDGRHPGNATGMTLHELARFMQALGCVEALNLDGGGSTTMWVRDKGIVNHPSDNQQFDADGARVLRTAVVVMDGQTSRSDEE